MCNSFGCQKVHLLYFYNLCLWIWLKNWHSVSRKISGCIFVYADLFLCLYPLKLIHWVMWYIFYISDKTLSMSNVPVKVIIITSRSTNTNLRGGAGTQITKKVCLSHLNDLKHVNITFLFYYIWYNNIITLFPLSVSSLQALHVPISLLFFKSMASFSLIVVMRMFWNQPNEVYNVAL